MKDIFENTSDSKLKEIYLQIMFGRENGIRPRGLDNYIRQIQEVYPLSFGEAWSYAEKMFWDEVGRRYFEGRRCDL